MSARRKHYPKLKPSACCYICENRVGSTGERDHFPIPAEIGGEMVEPICRSCHDMKDRYTLARGHGISLSEGAVALMGLWQKANTDERLMLAKMTRYYAIALDQLRRHGWKVDR